MVPPSWSILLKTNCDVNFSNDSFTIELCSLDIADKNVWKQFMFGPDSPNFFLSALFSRKHLYGSCLPLALES